MNKNTMIGVGAGLLVLAILIFMFTRSSSAGDSSDLSKEVPKARADAPTFAPDVPVVSGGRGGKGRSTDDVKAPGAAGETAPQ